MFATARCTCFYSVFLFALLFNFCASFVRQESTVLNNVPLEFPTNKSQYPIRYNATLVKFLTANTRNDTVDDDVPFEFPKNESGYHFVHNETLLKLLAEHTMDKSEVSLDFPKSDPTHRVLHNLTLDKALTLHTLSDAELDDLLHGGQFAHLPHDPHPKAPEAPQDAQKEAHDVNRKWDAEVIEDGTGTEERRANKSAATKPGDCNEAESLGVQGQPVILITTGVFLVVAVIAYLGTFLWNRSVERRMRQGSRLVNEQDPTDPSDLSHFSG